MARRDHGALVERDEVDLAKLEDRVAADSTAKLKAKLERLTLRGLALYRSLDPGPDNVGARRMARNLLADQLSGLIDEEVRDSLREAIREGVDTAYRAGIEQAATEIGRNPADFLTPKPDELDDIDSGALDAAREEVSKAVNHMAGAETAEDVETAFAVARRSVTRTERAARSGVNRGLSAGTSEVAAATGTQRLWIAERDACLHCLAYAGLVAGTGADGRPAPFPGGRTFARKSYHPEPVANPPLHPNCRCRVRLWRAEWDGDGETSVPEALRREALRSVLRGWSLPSESERARLDAARRLLERGGLNMPKSVQDYARRSIRQGSFGKGRDFPDTPILDRPRRKSTRLRPDYTVPDDTGKRIDVPTRRDDLGGRESDAPLVEALSRKPDPDAWIGAQTKDAAGFRAWSKGYTSSASTGRRDPEVVERYADLRAVNPAYGTGLGQWNVNCQRVAVAYELRRRGFDVMARPNRTREGMWPASLVDKGYPDADIAATMRTSSGEVRDFETVRLGPADRALRVSPDPAAAKLRAIINSWPAGARGWVISTWIDGGRHIWNVEKDAKGVVWWIEAQAREFLSPDGHEHLDRAAELRVLRVDDLVPTDETARMVYRVVDGKPVVEAPPFVETGAAVRWKAEGADPGKRGT